MKRLSEQNEWLALQNHCQDIISMHMRDAFQQDPERFPRYTISFAELLFDYSRNRITDHTLKLLIDLAQANQLSQKIDDLFSGKDLNITEARPALHTALRDESHKAIFVKGENITEHIAATKARMMQLSEQVHNQTWLGVTGKPIRHIVNIGIGGSHLGPLMCTTALRHYNTRGFSFHFISTVDKANIEEVLQHIDLETSLFIVSSKTFTTIETMTNATTIAQIMQHRFANHADVFAHHFLAVTANTKRAVAFGIPEKNIFPMWNWVGGRYSVWSAIGLPVLLLLGRKEYQAFLHGAFMMDEHFKTAPFNRNIPVLLALLGVWYQNFFNSNLKAIVPYAYSLRYLVPYLQQLVMESNGKSVCLDGLHAAHAIGTIVFGEEGCNGQHAYHQLLLQGQHLIPVDFILFGNAQNKRGENDIHQQILIASGLSQAQALMRGKTFDEAYQELLQTGHPRVEAKVLAQHRTIPGNRPSTVLFFEQLSPQNLGMLIALYEHQIFVQGALWHINSFDQWGVELGKQLLPTILQRFQKENMQHDLNQASDSATNGLIQHFNALNHKAVS